METTTDRIMFARKEQLAARSCGNSKLEKTWSDAMDNLLAIYLDEKETNVRA